MISHSTATATQALRAHYPRLTILVLAFTARLVLAGCAASPAVLEPAASIQGQPSPNALSSLDADAVQAAPNAPALVDVQTEAQEAHQEEHTAEEPHALEARHDFIPGC